MAIKDDAAAKWWDSLGVPSVEADAFAVAFGAFCAGNRFSVSRFAKQIARYLIGVDGQVSEKSVRRRTHEHRLGCAHSNACERHLPVPCAGER